MTVSREDTAWDQSALGGLTDLQVYRSAVSRLSAEKASLVEELQAERRSRRDEVRLLQAQLSEALTPELLALRRAVSSWRDRALAAEARLGEKQRRGGAK